jgi:hypothetical protein
MSHHTRLADPLVGGALAYAVDRGADAGRRNNRRFTRGCHQHEAGCSKRASLRAPDPALESECALHAEPTGSIIDLAQGITSSTLPSSSFGRRCGAATRLFVGTKKQAQEALAGRPAVGPAWRNTRWLGGMLTNFDDQAPHPAARNPRARRDAGEFERLTKEASKPPKRSTSRRGARGHPQDIGCPGQSSCRPAPRGDCRAEARRLRSRSSR